MAENNGNESQEMKYFMNESISDVTFVVKGQRVPVIKLFLSMKSDVFEAMFSGNFKESNDKEIIINDTTFDAFKAMIGFLYSNQLVLSLENNHSLSIEVYKCGHKYHIKELMDCVEQVLIQMIANETFEDIYKFANLYKTEKLIKALNHFIDNNINEIMSKSMSEMKLMNKTSDNYLFEKMIALKDNEINELNVKYLRAKSEAMTECSQQMSQLRDELRQVKEENRDIKSFFRASPGHTSNVSYTDLKSGKFNKFEFHRSKGKKMERDGSHYVYELEEFRERD